MDLNHLDIIRNLVADPHLTRAAERLHVTQSALSKRVRAIEGELGYPLFERRGPRGLQALPQAHELAQLAEKVLGVWTSGIKRIGRAAEEPEHFVVVGPQLFLREIVLPWWNRTAHCFPSVQIEARVSPLSRVSLEAIHAGADAAIIEHKEELADYVCKPLYTERWGIVRHPQSRQDELRRHRWGTYSLTTNPVDTWLVQRQKLPPPRYHFYWQDLTAIAIWVAETPDAASVLPWHAVAWLAKRGRLSFEPLGPDATTRLYLAYSKNHPHRALLRSLGQIGAAVKE